MDKNRRVHPRYPAWLPGKVVVEPEATPVGVRVVDLSRGGAAIDGAVRAAPGDRVTLKVKWAGLTLTAEAGVVAVDEGGAVPRLHVQFTELTAAQALVVVELVGVMAAEFDEGQEFLATRGDYARRVVLPFREVRTKKTS